MIYDSLKHLDAYKGIHPGVLRGLELLREWNEPSKSWTERVRLWARVYRLT